MGVAARGGCRGCVRWQSSHLIRQCILVARAPSAFEVPVDFMAHVRHILMLSLILAAVATAAMPAEELTVVIEFQDDYSLQSVSAMKREVENIFRDSHVRIDWRSRGETAGGVVGNIAAVRFHGKCMFQPGISTARESAALAITHVSDGVVLPLSDVACDRIAALVRPEIHGTKAAWNDALFGRAMGRVVAHELVHMLSRSVAHGTTGVVEPALSARQLTSETLVLGWSGMTQSSYAPY